MVLCLQRRLHLQNNSVYAVRNAGYTRTSFLIYKLFKRTNLMSYRKRIDIYFNECCFHGNVRVASCQSIDNDNIFFIVGDTVYRIK